MTARAPMVEHGLAALWRELERLEARAAKAERRLTDVEHALALARVTRRVPAAEAARRLGVSPATVRRLLDSGELEGLALPPAGSERLVWSVDLASLEALERKRGAVGALGAPTMRVAGVRATRVER